MESPSELTPLVLLVDDQEWTSRSIESILRPKGHVVLKAYTGQQALDLVKKVSPDALIVDIHLPDINGIDLVRRLRASPTIPSITPIVMITGGTVGRAERLEALGAGAWDILTHPVDPNELILRMETFVRAKHDADRVRDEGLMDPDTGLYNARGILRRAKEVGADAMRFERPFTCIAFGSGSLGAGDADDRGEVEVLARQIASALLAVTRTSDTVGHLGPGEFVVVAPGTDEQGALRLADRVLEAVEADDGSRPQISLDRLRDIRAGFCAVKRGSEAMSPEDLLLKATSALRKAQADDGSFRVRAFDA